MGSEFIYIGLRPCGCWCFVSVDDGKHLDDLAKSICELIRDGIKVERWRIERFRNGEAADKCEQCKDGREQFRDKPHHRYFKVYVEQTQHAEVYVCTKGEWPCESDLESAASELGRFDWSDTQALSYSKAVEVSFGELPDAEIYSTTEGMVGVGDLPQPGVSGLVPLPGQMELFAEPPQ